MAVEFFRMADKTKNLISALQFMKKNYTLVGIPQAKTERKRGDPVTNAELLFIHTHGSPLQNIPARPVIEPAIEADRDFLADKFKMAAIAYLEGDTEGAYRQIKLAGMRGQNDARAWFTDARNGWPPNSPAVISVKIRKGSTDPRPLIDTGELRKSITYVVVKEGERVDGTN